MVILNMHNLVATNHAAALLNCNSSYRLPPSLAPRAHFTMLFFRVFLPPSLAPPAPPCATLSCPPPSLTPCHPFPPSCHPGCHVTFTVQDSGSFKRGPGMHGRYSRAVIGKTRILWAHFIGGCWPMVRGSSPSLGKTPTIITVIQLQGLQ